MAIREDVRKSVKVRIPHHIAVGLEAMAGGCGKEDIAQGGPDICAFVVRIVEERDATGKDYAPSS